jgi:hypothetical protein
LCRKEPIESVEGDPKKGPGRRIVEGGRRTRRIRRCTEKKKEEGGERERERAWSSGPCKGPVVVRA